MFLWDEQIDYHFMTYMTLYVVHLILSHENLLKAVIHDSTSSLIASTICVSPPSKCIFSTCSFTNHCQNEYLHEISKMGSFTQSCIHWLFDHRWSYVGYSDRMRRDQQRPPKRGQRRRSERVLKYIYIGGQMLISQLESFFETDAPPFRRSLPDEPYSISPVVVMTLLIAAGKSIIFRGKNVCHHGII